MNLIRSQASDSHRSGHFFESEEFMEHMSNDSESFSEMEDYHDTPPSRGHNQMNVGNIEHVVSGILGALIASKALKHRGAKSAIVGTLGAALLHRGTTGRCALYKSLGISTEGNRVHASEPWVTPQSATPITMSITIDRPQEELYGIWRNLSQLPEFFPGLERVEILSDELSRWITKGPRPIQWTSQLVQDHPNEMIEWRTVDPSDVSHQGSVSFRTAPGNRGTEIHVNMIYNPPAGKVGHLAAKMVGFSPDEQLKKALRRFKQLCETGEVPTSGDEGVIDHLWS